MEPTKEQIEKIKKIELEMLIEFVKICNELNLKYFLIGGTLLGSVRHQGFIPWDDDIDVGMPREDYEKFIKQGQSLLSENLFLQNVFTDNEYVMCFTKIRNSQTTFIETSSRNLRINHGVFIDVFPLDYYPDSESEQMFIRKRESWYKRRIMCEYELSEDKRYIRKIKKIMLKAIMPSVKKVVLKREELHKKISPSSLYINYDGAWGKKEIIPTDWFGSGVPLVFEGLVLNAPEKYDLYLKNFYGDYMQYPPIEKRVGHHYTEIVDLENSYVKYAK